jgi:thiol-disulfide isomerase/thioredoxin
MKKLIILILMLTISVAAQEKSFKVIKSKSGSKMLVGVCRRAELQKAPFGKWFNNEYGSYTPKFLNKNDLETRIKKFNILIVMGTWCPDSRREVPRFYKILDSLKFPETQLKLITVDRKKKGIAHETNGLNIQRVPTFIFYKDGNEVGRIIEHPSFDRLEDDVQNIVFKK